MEVPFQKNRENLSYIVLALKFYMHCNGLAGALYLSKETLVKRRKKKNFQEFLIWHLSDQSGFYTWTSVTFLALIFTQPHF